MREENQESSKMIEHLESDKNPSNGRRQVVSSLCAANASASRFVAVRSLLRYFLSQ